MSRINRIFGGSQNFLSSEYSLAHIAKALLFVIHFEFRMRQVNIPGNQIEWMFKVLLQNYSLHL